MSHLTDTHLVENTDLWDAYGLLDQFDALPAAHAAGYGTRRPPSGTADTL